MVAIASDEHFMDSIVQVAISNACGRDPGYTGSGKPNELEQNCRR